MTASQCPFVIFLEGIVVTSTLLKIINDFSGEWCEQSKSDYKKNENSGTRDIWVRVLSL